MKRLYFIILILFISSLSDLLSKKQFNNWYFGEGAGITFNTISGNPEALLDGALFTNEGCSTISDSSGNLLFYTDGCTVWNRLHKIMVNGYNLFGHFSSSHSALIVPKPGANYLYYIFTVDPVEDNINVNGFNYSIVDLSLDNGYGAVTEKNIHLIDTASERVAAVGHPNGKDVWIVAQDRIQKCFFTYLLTENGLENNPLKSICNINLSRYQAGIMKFSPDGKKIAFTFWVADSVCIFKFDDMTGQITDGVKIPINFDPYGLEFSESNQFLYITSNAYHTDPGYPYHYLFQYDITNHDPIKIKESEKVISETTSGANYWEIQMAPNHKIYMVRNTGFMSVINLPNEPGSGCDFRENVIYLEGNNSILGLPFEVQKYNPKKDLKLITDLTFCEDDQIYLIAGFYEKADYEWTGPLGFTSTIRNPTIENSIPEMSGTYFCRISRDNITIFESSIKVVVHPKEKIIFTNNSVVNISSKSYDLKAVQNPENTIITWYGINSNENTVKITQSGKYKVIVESPFGCIDSASITINLYPTYCEGDSIFLFADSYKNAAYLWNGPNNFQSTEKNPIISDSKVFMTGDYILRTIATDILTGKIDTFYKKIPVLVNPFEKITFSNIKKIIECKDSLELTALLNPDGYTINWKGIQSTENKVVVKTSGIYSVYIENQYGCTDSATIEVELRKLIDLKILSSYGKILCKGENIKLSSDNNYMEYSWSTGDKSKEIIISKSGWYYLNVISETGCKGMDSILIEEFDKPEISFENSNYTICSGDSILIKPQDIKPEYLYFWSDGFIGSERFINDDADLYIVAQNTNGCKDTAFIKVEKIETPVSKIITESQEACFGERITLKADNFNPKFDYLWSTGEYGESIVVSNSGNYVLTVTNKNLCSNSSNIDITIHPDLNLDLICENATICFNDSTTISAKSKYDKYLWSTGETTESIIVRNAGIYRLIVHNNLGCADTAQIEIFKFNSELVSQTELPLFNELCVGSAEIENVKLRLSTDHLYNISDIYFKSNYFSVIDVNKLLKSYNNGNIIEIPVLFQPSDAGEFFDTLVVESGEPCNHIDLFPIYGASKAYFAFNLPDIVTQGGNYLNIPINSGLTCKNSLILYSDYEMEIAFDKEYFVPENIKYGYIIENKILNQSRILKIKDFVDFSEKKDSLMTINIINGYALVGRKETTPITINYVKFNNTRYYPEYDNGTLRIEGCVNNLRSIQIFRPTALNITPNPAESDVRISVGSQEKGNFKVEIFNIQGQSILIREFAKSESGFEEFEFNFDSNNIGSGVYSVNLTTPWNILRKPLVISR